MAGAAADVVVSDSTAEGALKAIIDYVGGGEFVRGLSFLIPRARIAAHGGLAIVRALTTGNFYYEQVL